MQLDWAPKFLSTQCNFTVLSAVQVPEAVRARNDEKKLELEAELEQTRDAIMKLEAMETE